MIPTIVVITFVVAVIGGPLIHFAYIYAAKALIDESPIGGGE